MLTPLVLTLGAATLLAVLKSRPQELPVIQYMHPDLVSAERVTVIPGFIKATPDTPHHHYLEAHDLREIRAVRGGQTVERRTFPAARS